VISPNPCVLYLHLSRQLTSHVGSHVLPDAEVVKGGFSVEGHRVRPRVLEDNELAPTRESKPVSSVQNDILRVTTAESIAAIARLKGS